MNGKTVMAVLLVLVLIAGAAAFGVYVYQVGVAQGIAQSGKLPVPDTGAAPYPYYRPFFRPFGFGFGFLGCLGPLLFVFLIFALVRGLFWGGRWRMHRHGGMMDHGVPPMLEEWHRKMHEPKTPEST